MVDLCSRHPHYRAVRVGNPIQALQSPQKVYRIRKEEKLQLQLTSWIFSLKRQIHLHFWCF